MVHGLQPKVGVREAVSKVQVQVQVQVQVAIAGHGGVEIQNA